MKKYKHSPIWLIFIAVYLTFGGCCSDKNSVKIRFGEQTFRVETAQTETERARGLMYRRSLNPQTGMLFVYSYEQTLSFWMKNTLIPLDIAFISADGIIINIETMEPLDESTVSSKGEAMYALEMNRGFFAKHNIKAGDRIQILEPLQYTLE